MNKPPAMLTFDELTWLKEPTYTKQSGDGVNAFNAIAGSTPWDGTPVSRGMAQKMQTAFDKILLDAMSSATPSAHAAPASKPRAASAGDENWGTW